MNIIQKLKSWNPFDSRQTHYNNDYILYLNNRSKINPNTVIGELEFITIDGESTGLDTVHDSLVSIALLPISSNTIYIDQIYTTIIPTNKISTSAEIHGLLHTTTELDTYEIIKKIYQSIGNKIIVGHYIAFDVIMIQKLAKSFGFGKILNPIIDTATLAQRLDYTTRPAYIKHEDYTLDNLCKKYDIITKARHTADGDSFITAMLLLKLLHHLELRGIKNWKGLAKKW